MKSPTYTKKTSRISIFRMYPILVQLYPIWVHVPERRVNLNEPIPVWILYRTAVVREDGEVHFLEDIYGRDAALERALEKQPAGTSH